jgi:hypothetical protein
MLRRLAQSTLCVAAILALAPTAAHACVIAARPGPPPTASQRVADSAVAFTGRVVATARRPDGLAGTTMSVAVDRVLKGDVPATVALTSSLSDCSRTFSVGQRVGLAMTPDAGAPPPWDVSIFDDVGAAALDVLPVDAAYAPLKVVALAGRPSRRTIQAHVLAHACADLRPVLTETARGVAVAVTGADGPRCHVTRRVDRCVALTAERSLGDRALRPRGARRVAAATPCRAFAS